MTCLHAKSTLPSKLRFLLYPSHLTPSNRNRILQDDAVVIWLGKNQESQEAPGNPCKLK